MVAAWISAAMAGFMVGAWLHSRQVRPTASKSTQTAPPEVVACECASTQTDDIPTEPPKMAEPALEIDPDHGAECVIDAPDMEWSVCSNASTASADQPIPTASFLTLGRLLMGSTKPAEKKER